MRLPLRSKSMADVCMGRWQSRSDGGNGPPSEEDSDDGVAGAAAVPMSSPFGFRGRARSIDNVRQFYRSGPPDTLIVENNCLTTSKPPPPLATVSQNTMGEPQPRRRTLPNLFRQRRSPSLSDPVVEVLLPSPPPAPMTSVAPTTTCSLPPQSPQTHYMDMSGFSRGILPARPHPPREPVYAALPLRQRPPTVVPLPYLQRGFHPSLDNGHGGYGGYGGYPMHANSNIVIEEAGSHGGHESHTGSNASDSVSGSCASSAIYSQFQFDRVQPPAVLSGRVGGRTPPGTLRTVAQGVILPFNTQ
jgi:hypothetical protein